MNILHKTLLATALAASVANVAHADSTYGYAAAAATTPQVSAMAHLNVTVSVPKLLILRVGTSGTTVDTASITGSFAAGIPSGVATLAVGNSLATGWSGVAPVLSSTASAAVQAWAWTNSSGGGTVTPAVTTAFPAASGLTSASVLVTPSTVSGGGLAHPANTSLTTNMAFATNTVASSNWVFNLAPTALTAVTAGINTQVMTYTANTL